MLTTRRAFSWSVVCGRSVCECEEYILDAERTVGRLDRILWPPRKCKYCRRWAKRWQHTCGLHGAVTPTAKRAAARRRWTAYAATSPAALDAARELLASTKLTPNNRAKLAAAVLAIAAAPERLPKLG